MRREIAVTHTPVVASCRAAHCDLLGDPLTGSDSEAVGSQPGSWNRVWLLAVTDEEAVR